MNHFLSSIDLFGNPIKMNIKNKTVMKTSFGGILTVNLLLLILIMTWFIGKDIMYKQVPFSYQQTSINLASESININNYIFPLAFKISDMNSQPVIDPNLFNLTFTYFQYKFDSNAKQLQIHSELDLPMHLCNYSDFPYVPPAVIDQTTFKTNFCPQYLNFNLSGSWSEDHLSFLQIKLKKCNSKVSNSCAPKEVIDNLISDKGISMSINSFYNILAINNYKEPISYTLFNSYKYANSNFQKLIEFEIRTEHLMTDSNYFFSEWEDQPYFNIYKTNDDTLNFKDDTFIVFNIYSSRTMTTIYRKYIKVPDIIASIGGLIKVFMIIFEILNIPFSNISKNLILHNNFSDINQDKERTNTKNKRRISPFKSPLSNIKKFVETSNTNLRINSSEHKHISKEASLNENRISFSSCDYLSIFCFKIFKCKAKESKAIEKWNSLI